MARRETETITIASRDIYLMPIREVVKQMLNGTGSFYDVTAENLLKAEWSDEVGGIALTYKGADGKTANEEIHIGDIREDFTACDFYAWVRSGKTIYLGCFTAWC